MDKKTTGIVAYITPIGWLIAFLAGDKEGAKFQLNQTLVLWIASIVLSIINALPFSGVLAMVIGIIVLVCDIIILVCWIIGLIGACKGEDKAMPIIGGIKILS